MKRVFALLFLLAFSAQTFSQAIVILNFYFHRSTIAAQCENRYRPMLHCNGKCQLAKRLKQQEKKEQQNPELKLENKSEVFTSISFLAFKFELPGTAVPAYHAACGSKPVDRPSLIFHPPGVDTAVLL